MTATAVSALLAAGTAGAQPTAADRETARSMMQEGRDLRDKGDMKGALEKFRAADNIMHVPTTGLEVARAQVALGQLVEALDTIAAIRKTPQAADDPAPFKEARQKAEDLDSQVEAKTPTLTITVTGAGENETPILSIDGTSLPPGSTGIARKIDPGHHEVTAKSASGEATQEIDVADGEKRSLELKLVPNAEASEGGGTPASEGSHKVVHSPGAVTYAAGGIGAVGLVLGTITGVLVMSKKSDLESSCGAARLCPAGDAANTLNAANTLATVSDIAFAVGGVGVGVAIVSLIVGHKAPAAPAATPADTDSTPGNEPAAAAPGAESRIEVTPWVGLGSAGLAGTF